MRISAEGVALIKRFEGCPEKDGVVYAYQDSVGVWTIGFGHTKEVNEGDTCTREEAEEMLATELEEYEGYINDLVDVPLLQSQFDALVAWVYNLGPTNLRESTLLRVLNEENYVQVPSEIKRWNRAGGQVLGGLVRRREAEALLFQGDDCSAV